MSVSSTLLVIDIGNTNVVFGVYRDDTLVNHWRLSTVLHKTVDEYAMLVESLLAFEELKLADMEAAIISCVVPPLLISFRMMCCKYIGIDPIVIEPGIKTGMPILYDNPQEVGADRIVNAVAGYEKHKKALIIVDFGTATTFDYVTPKGEYVGGAIAPGVMISMEALFERASKLPRVELVKPKEIIGKNTVNAMQDRDGEKQPGGCAVVGKQRYEAAGVENGGDQNQRQPADDDGDCKAPDVVPFVRADEPGCLLKAIERPAANKG